jgi:hypothetical protein
MASLQKENTTRRFRSTIPLVGGSTGALLFFLLGIATVTTGLNVPGQIFAGAFIAAIGILIAAGVGTSLADLTPTGLSYRFNFRLRTIPWASIESLRIAPALGLNPWYILVVDLKRLDSVRVGSITGTRRFVQQVIDECERYRSRSVVPDRPQ